MTLIGLKLSRIPPTVSRTPSPGSAGPPGSDQVVRPLANPFLSDEVVEPIRLVEGDARASSQVLEQALLDVVQSAIDETSVTSLSTSETRARILDGYYGEGLAQSTGGINPYEPGSSAWFDYGKETGLWFEIPLEALEVLVSHHRPLVDLRPDPDADAPPRTGRLDHRGAGVVSHSHELVLAYLDQMARASAFLSQAAASGAEVGQLLRLHEGVLEHRSMEIQVSREHNDVLDQLERDDSWDLPGDTRGHRAAQIFWMQMRVGKQDAAFGNIHTMLADPPLANLSGFAEDSRIAMNITAAGDQMMRRLLELSKSLDVELYEDDGQRKETIADAVTDFQRDQAMKMVELAMMEGGPAELQRLGTLANQLVEAAFSDPDQLAQRLDKGSRPK